jgi:hypothetical protein
MKECFLERLVPCLEELAFLDGEACTAADLRRLSDMRLHMGLSDICYLGPPWFSKYL